MEYKINIAEKELYYKGEVIVKYVIQYPEIIKNTNEEEVKAFNHFYRKKALMLKDFAEGKFYSEAKNTYDFNKLNNYPTIVYELFETIK